jgi:hypothetical protein
MCLVIDTCCLAKVFDGRNRQHFQFVPVLNWITSGKGRMIYGGTKYRIELGQARKFVGIIAELARRGKTIQIPDDAVDGIAAALKARLTDTRFDDEHLVALVIASRCFVVCTTDHVAIAYLKHRDVYSSYNVTRPKIYSSYRNRDLCCDRHLIQFPRARA